MTETFLHTFDISMLVDRPISPLLYADALSCISDAYRCASWPYYDLTLRLGQLELGFGSSTSHCVENGINACLSWVQTNFPYQQPSWPPNQPNMPSEVYVIGIQTQLILSNTLCAIGSRQSISAEITEPRAHAIPVGQQTYFHVTSSVHASLEVKLLPRVAYQSSIVVPGIILNGTTTDQEPDTLSRASTLH